MVDLELVSAALGQEVREHLNDMSASNKHDGSPETHLDGVKGSTCALGVELHTPHFLARFSGRLDALHGRVIAVDEERFPALRERTLELQSVLMVLAISNQKSKGLRAKG